MVAAVEKQHCPTPRATAERAPTVKVTTSVVSLTVATRGAKGYYDVALPLPPFDGGRGML